METTPKIRKTIAEKLPYLFHTNIFCAGATVGSQGSCKGDSGGPLMYKDSLTDQWVQIATVQGGIRHCGDSEYPELYIRLDVPDILSFIKSVLYLNFVDGKSYEGDWKDGEKSENETKENTKRNKIAMKKHKETKEKKEEKSNDVS